MLAPINTSAKDTSESQIASEVEHAYQIGLSHLEKIKDWMKCPVAGLSVLELGPGPNFGSALTVGAFGATISVADRWVSEWEDAYHGAIYSALADRIDQNHPDADTSALRKLVANRCHSPDIVTIHRDAEALEGLSDQTFDLILSNAVYEHIVDVNAAAKRCYDVTKLGGWNVHQIDFRDHRDFSRPLEYLLMTQEEEDDWLKATDHHLGSQRRRGEYESAFALAGFQTKSEYVTEVINQEYLADFLPRIRSYDGAVLQSAPKETFEILSICYVLKR